MKVLFAGSEKMNHPIRFVITLIIGLTFAYITAFGDGHFSSGSQIVFIVCCLFALMLADSFGTGIMNREKCMREDFKKRWDSW